MNQKRLILASTSPRRKEILSSSGLLFEVVPSDYEEDMTLAMEPKNLAKYLSKRKAETVANKYPDSVVIGADTFVEFEGEVLGKPHTKEKAKETLHRLNGRIHSIITGFTVIDASNAKCISQAVETKVVFKRSTDKEIDEYIATGEPLDKAGSYAIQGIGKSLVERIEGDYNNIVGLPLDALLNVLKGFGVIVPNR